MQATAELQETEAQELPENMRKYYNYREQMGRLKKAINMEFYFEAVFIEYAVMEDRLQSVLEKAGVYNPEKHKNIGKKISRIRELCRDPKHPLHRYITQEMLDLIINWKETRNDLIHRLMKQDMKTEELKDFALQGQEIMKTLCSKVTLYKRYLERSEKRA